MLHETLANGEEQGYHHKRSSKNNKNNSSSSNNNTNQRTRFLLRRCRAVSSMTNSHVGVGAFHGGEHGTTTAT